MFLKKALAFILSASMALSAAVLPTTASADDDVVTINVTQEAAEMDATYTVKLTNASESTDVVTDTVVVSAKGESASKDIAVEAGKTYAAEVSCDNVELNITAGATASDVQADSEINVTAARNTEIKIEKLAQNGGIVYFPASGSQRTPVNTGATAVPFASGKVVAALEDPAHAGNINPNYITAHLGYLGNAHPIGFQTSLPAGQYTLYMLSRTAYSPAITMSVADNYDLSAEETTKYVVYNTSERPARIDDQSAGTEVDLYAMPFELEEGVKDGYVVLDSTGSYMNNAYSIIIVGQPAPVTAQANEFDMPVTITQEAAAVDNTYTVKVKDGDGYVRGKTTITVDAQHTKGTGTIEGLDKTFDTYTVETSCSAAEVHVTSSAITGTDDNRTLAISAERKYNIEYYDKDTARTNYFLTGRSNSGNTGVATAITNDGSSLGGNYKPLYDEAVALFGDGKGNIDTKYTDVYLNYIGNSTSGSGTALTFDAKLPAGTYNLYYLGKGYLVATGDDPTTVKIGDIDASRTDDYINVTLASNMVVSRVSFTVDTDMSAAETVTINRTANWLPDVYAVIISGTPAAEVHGIYDVTLNANGGTIADGKDVTEYTEGTAVSLPTAEDITKNNFTFAGWYEDADFSGEAVTEIAADASGDKTYYAKWTSDTAKTGKVTTTIDRKVKTVTFTKGDTVKTIDATKYYSELQYIEGVDVKTKDIELTFDEADFGEYAITTEAYAPSTFELISKIGGEAVTKVTVGDGSDIALTVSGDVITTAPTTDYTKVKTSTVIWDMKRDKAWSPATIQYIDAVQGKENTYIAGALSDNTSAETDVYLIADTTSGKIQTWGRGDWMQVNDGTKFKIPAMKDTKITVTSYGTMTGTADEKSFTAANTYEYYYVGADNGLSELNFTSAGGYLGYIKTEPVTRKTVALTVTGETTGTLEFADNVSGDKVYASVTDANVALLPGQTYTITYGTMEESTFTPSEEKHVTNETKSFTVGDSTTTAAVTIEGGAAAKTGKVTLTMDSHVKKVTLVDKTDNTKKIELVSGVNTIEEDDFGEYDVVSTAIAPATYTLTTNPSTVTIAENSDIAIEVKGAIRTSDLPTTDYDVVKANTIEWTVVNATTSRPSSHIDVALQNKGDVAVAGAIQGQTDDAEVYMIVNTTTGKFNTRDSNNGYTQLNEGTVLKVPVAKDTKITLDGYGELKMSVDDETVSGNPIVYYYVGDANSYVNLTQGSGSNIWLKSVTTEPMPRKTVAVTVTGGTDGDCVKFTNDVTGDVQYGTIASSAASVSLLQGFTYAVDYGTKDGETFTASETKALENDSKSLAVSSSTTTAELTVNTLDPSTKHTITIDPSITHGTITTTPAAKADEDDEVTITAARDENYKLKADSVKVTKTGDNSTEVEVTDGKFIMPAYDVTVTAEFEASTETEGQLYVNGAYTSLETDATHFKTISEAVAAAKVINPQSEQNRVVINVYPGDYEEQVRMDQMKYVTLQQTPETNGKVNLSWYFCTNYYTSNTDLNGQYDPKIDWSLDETWNGYNEGDEEFTKYTIGQDLSGVSKISYYDTDGVKHKDVAKNSMLDRLGGLAWSYDKMAPLIVTSSSSDITIKDLNLINSTVVMKTKGQDDGHLTPNPSGNLPDHKALSICDETTTLVKPTADIFDDGGSVNLTKYKAYVASQGADFKFTPGESAWLLQSSGFNERGHAIAILGDRIICENIRVRGNQDSVWVSDGRTYFKNCDLIGGTDYIYGSASAVFDHCKLGFVGFTDKSYGSPLATPNTPASRKYGYLFFNCTIYNVRDNNGANNFGGPWGVDGQSTFYNTVFDDKAEIGASPLKIEDKGWGRFGAENGLSRLYEFGTTNNSGAAVDLSKRIVNLSEAEDGPGMGTVLDKWQILEFNPRNVFSTKNDSKWSADWDPMNFASQLADTDAALNSTTVSVPAGNTSEVTLPTPTDNNIEFHWESNSTNAIVSEDGTKLTVVRPALGESSIDSSVILYARNKTTGYGDKKEIPVTIAASTDTENVFNIPVTITASVAPEAAVEYAVTIKKGGALIKSQTITMPLGSRTVTATIENIPASASGIDYDVEISSESDDFTITSPEAGKTTVNGKTGVNVPLAVTAQKIVDDTITTGITASSTDNKSVEKFDLIALAKANGAEDIITSSDVITVSYTLTVNQDDKTSGNSFIDILSDTPSDTVKQSGVNSRFVLAKLGHWNQLDMVDSAQKYSGASNGPDQWLNATGNFTKNGEPAYVTVTIDYKNQTITATGKGTNALASYTFETFPSSYEKGKLNMAVYFGGEAFTVSDVSVTYKKPVVQKYTVTITGGEGIEDVKLGTITGTKSGNTYTFTDVLAGEYTFDVTYTTGYEKADASPASITVSDDKTAETISAKLTEVTPPAPTQVFLDLLQGQNIRIEKKAGADANSVEFEVLLAEGLTDVPVPELSAYVAVYDGTALKSVNIVPFTNNKATITKPAVSGTESYKVFIWENGNSSPVIAPITAETTGNNKLF